MATIINTTHLKLKDNLPISRNKKSISTLFGGTTSDTSYINLTMKHINQTRRQTKIDDNKYTTYTRRDAFGVIIEKGSKCHKVTFIDNVGGCCKFAELIEYYVEVKEKKRMENCIESAGCVIL